jgi:Tol biopolymer transport system component
VRIAPLLLALLLAPGTAERRTDSPLDHLPANVEVLTRFGERADISPDDRRVAFMAKSFGDAFVIDLATREIRCLTGNVPGAAFLRVMHLPSGDYLLIGPERFEDVQRSRSRDNELWFLSRKAGSRPVRLGRKMSEGAAVSKRSTRIAYSVGHAQDPSIPEGRTRLVVADLDPTGEKPALKNEQVVFTSDGPNCFLEAQDFFDEDRRLTYSCYEPEGRASAWTIQLATGERVNQTAAIGFYNEPEGIFPDGRYTCVESDHQSRAYGDPASFRNIDIWKLGLDGTGRDFTRLTTFNAHEGWKASNPVVSRDGRFMAFQVARTADEAGVGYGILLMHFDRPAEPKGR